MNYFKKYDRITGWLVFAIAAAVYLLTMEPTAQPVGLRRIHRDLL